jgi:hypothetical protein
MNYIFLKHRADGIYHLRIHALNNGDYRRMVARLKAYIPYEARAFDVQTRTWTIQEEYKREIELWVAGVMEELNPSYAFYCEREDTWEAKVAESYRTLHLRLDAPREVITAAYQQLVMLRRMNEEGSHELAEKLDKAYEFIMRHIGDK